MVNLRINSNYRAMEREAERLENLSSSPKTKATLDKVLDLGFKMTQTAVHVQTGSLKSSGKMSSEMVGEDWKGVISYGGPSMGINNPVTYAIYEKARDGEHDFMVPLTALNILIPKAMLKLLEK